MRRCVRVVLFFFLLAYVPLNAQSVPIELQVKFILKIAGEDKNFACYGSPIKIGVTSDEALAAFKATEGTLLIKGINYVTQKMAGLDDIAKQKMVLIGPEWSANYSAAAAICKSNGVPMFCCEEAPVLSNGAAIGFKVMDGKPKISVNLTNSSDQGCDFNAGFLKVTVIVGGLNQ